MEHFDRLKRMYLGAPIHHFYEGITMSLDTGKCAISLPIDQRYFHAAMAVHGSVYFKLLDDACYFACQSLIHDFFLLTAHFETDLKRPITEGLITANAEFKVNSGHKFEAQATLINSDGKICGAGKGIFVKSQLKLEELTAYNN